ncbi:putative alpha/beta hydrolase family protein [Virgibacillus halotolerans]|uniref:alpha/beta fold hydrolase n=1 Tax=Virgibacillus halotolerans TaxID=1071053 RepID=UPI0019617287|nr:alpha/beta fold hydrolase [Virgibacillus halotolerans]MBM7599798.1 putative alpha/beta hydrolase family protein [Virgibacillus halotolerans]
MKKQHIIAITSSCIILLGVLTILYLPNKASSGFHTQQPTVFVHGYKGTANSFGFMLDRFEHEYHWGNKALVYYVAENGAIHVHNLNEGQGDPTFIQVIFENNRASLEDGAKWLAAVFDHMQQNYYIDKVNLVGHSMGGLVSVKYLESYQGDVHPNVKKLITIGSPFDGIYAEEYFQINQDAAATDLKPNSAALKLLHEGDFPKNIDVLSIGSTGDMIAVPESVQSLRTIVPDNQLQEVMINNEDLGHSGLHEDEAVDRLIHSFLWKDTEK